jgi:signal transduction histidine kinase
VPSARRGPPRQLLLEARTSLRPDAKADYVEVLLTKAPGLPWAWFAAALLALGIGALVVHEAARRGRDEYRAALQLLGSRPGVVRLSPGRRVTRISARARSLLGEGLTIGSDFAAWLERNDRLQALQRALERADSVSSETCVVRMSDDSPRFLAVVTRVRSGYLIGVENPRGGVEQLYRLLDFTAEAAHRIKNDLASARLATDALSGRGAAEARTIQEQIDRVTEKARAILRFTRPDAARPVPTDVNAAVEDELRDYALRWPGIELRRHLQVGLPLVDVDPGQFREVLRNLLDNAVQAMQGRGVVTVASSVADDSSEVAVEVVDAGEGIPEQMRQRLFKPYSTGRPGGTGLGLWIVATVMEACGGRVELDSEPGSGTRARLVFPVRKGDR